MLEVETDSCIDWIYATTSSGYGVFNYDGSVNYVHRLALMHKVGSQKGKNLALHKPLICHRRKCFNYRHLYWGDSLDNMKDRRKDGTDLRGESIANSKLDREKVIEIKKDIRTQAEIARSYRVSQSLVSRIKNGSRWSWL